MIAASSIQRGKVQVADGIMHANGECGFEETGYHYNSR